MLEKNEKPRPEARQFLQQSGQILLDLAFFVFNMLTLYGVILVDRHFLGHGPGILFGHIEVPGASRRVQTDLDRRRFGHSRLSCIGKTALSREIS
jgi:hypothetical protein